tara:strand:+ start:339 stop:920 length:582 start_codon:yes stop_codon:yes gene_type:complete
MDAVSNWSIFAVIVSTVAAAVTAWMAIETRRMALTANKALELERMPILGLKDIQVEVSTKQEKGGDSDGVGVYLLTGVRVGLELFNAGRVPVRYTVNSLTVSFASRVPESEQYLSRRGQVLPGGSTIFWHSGIPLDPPIGKFPNKGRITIDCEYSDDSGDDTKPLKETIEFTLSGAAPGSRTNWLHVDDAGTA